MTKYFCTLALSRIPYFKNPTAHWPRNLFLFFLSGLVLALFFTPTGQAMEPGKEVTAWTSVINDNSEVFEVVVEVGNLAGTDNLGSMINMANGPVCPVDLTAYWKLDETSSGIYYDFYNVHNGSCAGDCPIPTTGQVDGGQVFSSTSGIDVPANAAFDWGAADSFSIEVWMKGIPGQTCPTTNSSSEVMAGRDNGGGHEQWWLGCRTGRARFKVGDTSGDFLILENAGPNITDGTWHHIVGLRDGVNNLNRLYVDGVEVISATKTYSSSFAFTSAAINLGWINKEAGFHFKGTLDEMAVYSKALSAAEIQQHYSNGLDKLGVCELPPSITIAKRPDTQTVVRGSPATFTITVTNTNDVTVTNVAVTDALAPDCSRSIDDLDAEGHFSYTCTVDNVAASFTNSATVTGNTFFGGSGVTDTDTADVDVINPPITIAKTPDMQTVASGSTVTFTITVTNTGDVTLTNITVSDVLAPNCSATLGSLDPTESTSYTCTVDNVTADFTNSATVIGTPPIGADVTDTDTATVTIPWTLLYLPLILK